MAKSKNARKGKSSVKLESGTYVPVLCGLGVRAMNLRGRREIGQISSFGDETANIEHADGSTEVADWKAIAVVGAVPHPLSCGGHARPDQYAAFKTCGTLRAIREELEHAASNVLDGDRRHRGLDASIECLKHAEFILANAFSVQPWARIGFASSFDQNEDGLRAVYGDFAKAVQDTQKIHADLKL